MRTFKLTHADKVFWPQDGYTKGDMLAYYERVAPYLLPHLKDRPVVLKRYPDGIAGEKFFQKNVAGEVPAFVKRVTIPAETVEKNVHYILCNNPDTLRYLVQLGTVELHPWNSRVKKTHHPDWLLFDLDPGEGTGIETITRAAHLVREVLEECGAKHLSIKTSGKRGLHIAAMLGAAYTYDAVRDFAHRVAIACALRDPKLATAERGEEHRRGKVFIDYLRNAVGQTAVAPYSLRAVDGARASTPLHWSEVTPQLDLGAFTLRTLPARLEREGDLWLREKDRFDIHKARELLVV